MTDEIIKGQVSLFDHASWSGRTCPAACQAPESETEKITEGKTSKPSSRKSSKSSAQMLPMFLYLQTGNGQSQDALWVREKTDAHFPSPGEYTMPSFGESPREENASLLSQILEDAAPQKYSLSEKACMGILRRAAKRGKELPEVLKKALETQCS